MKTIIIIKADYNDGDYLYSFIEEKELKSVEDTVTFLKKISSVISKNNYHSWTTNDRAENEESPQEMYKGLLTEDEIESFNMLLPYNEYGLHTIKSIRILKVENDVELLK
jgi:hypothetical protein